MNHLNPNDLAEELRIAGIEMAETESAAAFVDGTIFCCYIHHNLHINRE